MNRNSRRRRIVGWLSWRRSGSCQALLQNVLQGNFELLPALLGASCNHLKQRIRYFYGGFHEFILLHYFTSATCSRVQGPSLTLKYRRLPSALK